ncbi:MAG: glucuronate isomerase [Faecalibacterium prausnitzii]
MRRRDRKPAERPERPPTSAPKTIIYSLNPADDAQIGTILGCFQNSEVPGKIQHGSAWWFNDHKIGMEEQMTRLANLGLLGNFVGMLTDSRSFPSYTRHDYFRRILCNLIGQWVEDGEYPNDEKALEKMRHGHLLRQRIALLATCKSIPRGPLHVRAAAVLRPFRKNKTHQGPEWLSHPAASAAFSIEEIKNFSVVP